MSVLKGRLKELENVLIDYFHPNDSHTCFFLTHCHSDHMYGIKELLPDLHKKKQCLYCSPLSRIILLNMYEDCGNVIKELNTSAIITVPENDKNPSYQMRVTPIPAGHCPGSVMFLFETVNKTILYTGDFRISEGDIEKFKLLHNYNQVKVIDKLYYDATFFNKDYWYFPSRSKVVFELIKIIKNWLQKYPDCAIILETSASYGYEYVFTEISRELKCKVHVDNSLYNLFSNVPEVGYALTKLCKETKVHAIRKRSDKCLDFQDYDNTLIIKLSAQWYKANVDRIKNLNWIKINKNKIVICYSTHCSCRELIYFLKYLKPAEMEACTSTVGHPENIYNIEELGHFYAIKYKQDKNIKSLKTISHSKNKHKFKIKIPTQTKNYEDFFYLN